MTGERKTEIINQLIEKRKEILAIVGDDLPDDGYISFYASKNDIMISIMRGWDGEHTKEERTVIGYYEAMNL